MRVLILDDHLLFLDGLRSVVGQFDWVDDIDTAQDARGALELIDAKKRYGLILVDLAMPGLDGFNFLTALRERRIATPVVVISATSEPSDVRRALQQGALGFIPKSYSADAMLQGLRRVIEGDTFVPAELWPAVFGGRGESLPREVEPGIGPRQLEVLRLMAQGHTNRDIANILNIQEATVKSHVAALFRMLNVKNRTACVREAARQQLVTLSE
jgi:DNA-binding NarL/FixJ family response regulator